MSERARTDSVPQKAAAAGPFCNLGKLFTVFSHFGPFDRDKRFGVVFSAKEADFGGDNVK